MAKVSEYLVVYNYKGQTDYDHIQALSAQQAADFVRGDSDDIQIVDVAKIVNNWR